MAGGGRAAAAGPHEMDPLIALATSRPWVALTRSRAVLAERVDDNFALRSGPFLKIAVPEASFCHCALPKLIIYPI